MNYLETVLTNGVEQVRSDSNIHKAYESIDEKGNVYRIDSAFIDDKDTLVIEANGVVIALVEMNEDGINVVGIKDEKRLMNALLSFAMTVR